MFIQIKSNNPKVSYVLGKNPESGMMIKSVRQGRAFGWYSDNQTFNIWFKDSETGVSYKSHPDEEFEYVNTTRFNSAMCVLNLLSDFFNKTVKETAVEDTVGYEHELTINMLRVTSNRVLEFAKYIEGFKVDVEELSIGNYRIRMSTNKTIRELLNFTNLFCLYATLKNSKDYFDISKDSIEKYLSCLELIDPPYFVRYIFKLNLLFNKGKFDKYKKLLETTKQHKHVDLTFGDTGLARRNWLKSIMTTPNKDIVDVGCGEGFYVFDLAKKLPDEKTYYAVDIDPEVREILTKKIGKKKVENVTVLENQTGVESFEGKDVLFIEVMEHMEYDKAVELGKKLVSKSPDRLFITTPNRTFNKNYFEDDRLRHDDHQFELTYDEFAKYIDEINLENKYDVKFCDIGDSVDFTSTTLGAVLTRKEAANEI